MLPENADAGLGGVDASEQVDFIRVSSVCLLTAVRAVE